MAVGMLSPSNNHAICPSVPFCRLAAWTPCRVLFTLKNIMLTLVATAASPLRSMFWQTTRSPLLLLLLLMRSSTRPSRLVLTRANSPSQKVTPGVAHFFLCYHLNCLSGLVPLVLLETIWLLISMWRCSLTRSRLSGPSGPVKLAKKEAAAKPAAKVSLSWRYPLLW